MLARTPHIRPIRKLRYGAIGGAIAIVAVWLLEMNGVDVPEEVERAIGLIVASIVAYLARPAPEDAERVVAEDATP